MKSRRSKYTTQTRDRALQLLKAGRSHRAVRQVLKAEGHNPVPSAGTIVAWARELQASKAALMTSTAPDDATTAPPVADRAAEVEALAPVDPKARMLALLEEQSGVLIDAARKALVEGNTSAVTACSRALSAASKEIRAMTPEPEPEVQQGQYVTCEAMDEAALMGASKLRSMLAKGLEERATWPRCAHCGAPMRPEGSNS